SIGDRSRRTGRSDHSGREASDLLDRQEMDDLGGLLVVDGTFDGAHRGGGRVVDDGPDKPRPGPAADDQGETAGRLGGELDLDRDGLGAGLTDLTGRPEHEVGPMSSGESVGATADVRAGERATGVGLPAAELALADDGELGICALEGDGGAGDLAEVEEAAGTDASEGKVCETGGAEPGGRGEVERRLAVEQADGVDRAGSLGDLESGAGAGR